MDSKSRGLQKSVSGSPIHVHPLDNSVVKKQADGKLPAERLSDARENTEAKKCEVGNSKTHYYLSELVEGTTFLLIRLFVIGMVLRRILLRRIFLRRILLFRSFFMVECFHFAYSSHCASSSSYFASSQFLSHFA